MTDIAQTARYRALKADYEAVRVAHPEANLKPYDELNDDEKAKHEAVYEDTHNFFQRLGESISTGGPLPDPFDRK
jgi:glutaredoxin-related protein